MKFIDYINNYNNLAQDSWVLAYTFSKVYLEKLYSMPDELKNLDIKYLKEAMIFNNQEELKIWNYQGEVKQRIAEDEGKNIFEQKMLLWGNSIDRNRLIEKGRGIEINFPFDISDYVLPLKLVIKNYFQYDENGLINFYDARLVKIIDSNGMEVK